MRELGKHTLLIAAAVLLVVLLIVALCNALTRAHAVVYTVKSDKLTDSMRLALISDLHGCRYGKDQEQLMSLLSEHRPDAVLLCGDIFDSDSGFNTSVAFLEQISQVYPCYYVMGNHEFGTHRADEITALLDSLGIRLLQGECDVFTAGGTSIRIAGTDDLMQDQDVYAEQLDSIAATISQSELFTVLLSHEPQYVGLMLDTGADLLLSGHTHGGQWSIPGLLNGLYAPNQGLFPKYAGGEYPFGDQTLIISRGLSKKPLFVPRIFTPRELVILELVNS